MGRAFILVRKRLLLIQSMSGEDVMIQDEQTKKVYYKMLIEKIRIMKVFFMSV